MQDRPEHNTPSWPGLGQHPGPGLVLILVLDIGFTPNRVLVLINPCQPVSHAVKLDFNPNNIIR